MKHFRPLASALGCVALMVVACGGPSFEAAEGSAGTASGGDDDTAAGSGNISGGSATAGTSNAGTTSGAGRGGGTSNGGAASGGASSAGATSGGVSSAGRAGSATGGAPSGGSSGNSLACDSDTDCAACQYPTAPKSVMDCYCPSCGQTPLSKSACTANQTAWQKQCSQVPIACPGIACGEPPIPQCKSHMCVVTP
jgi:hypothetical protein